MKRMFKAFQFAATGLNHAYVHEQNLRIEIRIAGLILCAGFGLDITPLEWCIIFICISAVLSLEIINTAIERLCDRIQKQYDADIGLIKDLSSAAVLIAALGASICGAIVFIPKIISLFNV